jgi:hypothetical protein
MPVGTVNWCNCDPHGKKLFASYVPLYAVVMGKVGPVGLCAFGRTEECELATSGIAQNSARPVKKQSAPEAIRAVTETEGFFFICYVFLKTSGLRPIPNPIALIIVLYI